MRRYRTRPAITLATVTATVLTAGCAERAPTTPDPARASRGGASCRNIAGTISGFSVPVFAGGALVGFDVIGTGATGPLGGGTIGAELTVAKVSEDGTIHFVGTHQFVGTSIGTLTTSDRGTTTTEGRIHDTLTLVDGGTGSFQTHGTVDLATGALELRYHGRVCVERGDE